MNYNCPDLPRLLSRTRLTAFPLNEAFVQTDGFQERYANFCDARASGKQALMVVNPEYNHSLCVVKPDDDRMYALPMTWHGDQWFWNVPDLGIVHEMYA